MKTEPIRLYRAFARFGGLGLLVLDVLDSSRFHLRPSETTYR
jgi:hypothetical protein